MRLRSALVHSSLWCSVLCGPVKAAEPPRVAVLGFELVNTSPAPSTAEEFGRLHKLDDQLNSGLSEPGRYRLAERVMTAPPSIRSCHGCELDVARSLGADYVAYGWIQKVSNLILNINLVIEDVGTGRRVHAESVDIRGNTDESWQRGLRYMLNERVFRVQ